MQGEVLWPVTCITVMMMSVNCENDRHKLEEKKYFSLYLYIATNR